jgi:hypothetical protein
MYDLRLKTCNGIKKRHTCSCLFFMSYMTFVVKRKGQAIPTEQKPRHVMVKGLPSLSQALAVAQRKDQWKHFKRKVRKEQKRKEAGSAAVAERSFSGSDPACSDAPIISSEDGLSDGGMDADLPEDSWSGCGHADGLGDHSGVHGDQAAGGRASRDPDIMQQHILREGGWDKMFHLFAVSGEVSVGGIMRCCCPRTVTRLDGPNAAGLRRGLK